MSLYGLHIGNRGLALAKVGFSWTGKPTLAGHRFVEFPEGLLKDSFIDPNIRDLEEIGARWRELINPEIGRIRAIRISIPDTITKIFCLQFPQLPSSKKEIGKLIRYTIEDHLPFAWEDTVVRHQILGRSSGPGCLLVGAIKKTILCQYEELINKLGMIPLSIGVSSLCLLNLYGKNLRNFSEKDLLLINIYDSYFTIIICAKGIPTFFRVKPIRKDLSRGELTNRVTMELVNTISFYKESRELSQEASIYTCCPPEIKEELRGELEGLPKGEVKDLPFNEWIDIKDPALIGEQGIYRIGGAIAAALGT